MNLEELQAAYDELLMENQKLQIAYDELYETTRTEIRRLHDVIREMRKKQS